jgi:hypothetical protein
MNKFLMMSAAAVMGTMAAATQVNAGTIVASTFLLTSAIAVDVYKGDVGTYAGLMATTGGGSWTLQGFSVKGKFGHIKKSIGLSVPALDPYAATLQLATPIKTGSKWNIWVSTDATTGFIYASGTVTAGHLSRHQTTKSRLVDKLKSILGDRQKQ